MNAFDQKFEKVAKEIETLNKKYLIKGTPSGHENIWNPKRHVKLWIASRETAELLRFLVVNNEAKTILDLGTSVGYAALFLAYSAKITGGKVYTMELFEPKVKMAKRFFKKAKLDRYIIQIHSNIDEELKKWHRKVDLIFIDADKRKNLNYAKILLPYLREDGILVADDVVKMHRYTENFIKFIRNDKRLASFLLKIDRGLLLVTKKDLTLWSRFSK